MTPLEQQVRRVLDDDSLSDEARAAAMAELIGEHGREPVANAMRRWAEAKMIWMQSLMGDANALSASAGKKSRKQ